MSGYGSTGSRFCICFANLLLFFFTDFVHRSALPFLVSLLPTFLSENHFFPGKSPYSCAALGPLVEELEGEVSEIQATSMQPHETWHLLLLLLQWDPQVPHATGPQGGCRRGKLPVRDVWQRGRKTVSPLGKSFQLPVFNGSTGRAELDIVRLDCTVSPKTKKSIKWQILQPCYLLCDKKLFYLCTHRLYFLISTS